MADEGAHEPDSAAPYRQSDQEIFDEQIARASGKFIIQLGGLGILAAIIISVAALIVAAHRSNTTVTVASTPPTGQSGDQSTQLTGDALGQQIFVSGTPGGAEACGSCHTMKAAGTSGTTGPNLDQQLSSDPPSSTRESIVDPNKEIASGYRADVMPANYATALTPTQLDAVVTYVYHSTNTKFRHTKTP